VAAWDITARWHKSKMTPLQMGAIIADRLRGHHRSLSMIKFIAILINGGGVIILVHLQMILDRHQIVLVHRRNPISTRLGPEAQTRLRPIRCLRSDHVLFTKILLSRTIFDLSQKKHSRFVTLENTATLPAGP
jgi:hypothetical protein